MKQDLFDQLKRLLEYSGSEVKEAHKTADGVTARVEFGGEEHRIFVVPIKRNDVILEEALSYDY